MLLRTSRRPPLRALAVFEAAARHVSFQLAAHELHLTPSAVSHHIKTLESHLGQALFLRMNRKLRLTQTGARYYIFVRDALEKINEGTRQFDEPLPREILRISTGISFAQRWLLPRLPQFLAENPNIDIVLETRHSRTELRASEVDLEICYRPSSHPDMHIEPLRDETILPLCSPALLRGPRPLGHIRDLVNYTLIESTYSVVTWTMWLAQQSISESANIRRLRFDSTSLALQAAEYGLGVALEGDFLASEELASGRLVTPFLLRGTAICTPLRYLTVPEEKQNIETVQVFRNWLFREMRINGN